MPTVWDVMRVVRSSSLPPVARHLVLTLVSLGDPETCVIPDRFTPSLTDLTKFTGLSRSTVATQLNVVEVAGWVKRDKPDVRASWGAKARTRYFVQIPTSPTAALVRQPDQSERSKADRNETAAQGNGWSDSRTSPGAALVRENDMTSPGAGPEVPVPSTKDKKHSSPKTGRTKTPEPHRADVETLCDRLEKWMRYNKCRAPKITDAWRTEARRLLDLDKRPLDEATKLIDWCQKDGFWKGNILSMPTFREKYDQLRLRMEDEGTPRQPRQLPPSNAPVKLADDQRCPRHPSSLATNCGPCRSDRLGDPS